MPVWLLSALRLLGSRAGVLGTGVGALATGVGIPGIDLFPDDDKKRRRRRRRALTQGDRDDISFIAATISSAAAGKFAVQLATRSR